MPDEAEELLLAEAQRLEGVIADFEAQAVQEDAHVAEESRKSVMLIERMRSRAIEHRQNANALKARAARIRAVLARLQAGGH